MKRTVLQRKKNILEKSIKKQQKVNAGLIRDLQVENTLYDSMLANKKAWKLKKKSKLLSILNK